MSQSAQGIARKPDVGTTPANKMKVSVTDLKLGMYVCELDRSWLESPFAFQGFPLRTEADVAAVRRTCAYVYIDLDLSTPHALGGAAAPPPAARARPQGKPAPETSAGAEVISYRPKPSPVAWFRRALAGTKAEPRLPAEIVHSLEVAQRSFDTTARMVYGVLEEVRWGGGVDVSAAKESVSSCIEQITHNPDAMLLLGSIRSKDVYTAQHSLNCSIQAMILGHRLGMSRITLKDLGLSALLHDVGKLRAPPEILNKPGRLTPDEYRIMQRHPEQGRDILLACDGISRSALDVAYCHHERLDGSGYPRGLTDPEISQFAKIVAVADTYDAITSDRTYDEGRTSIEAVKILRAASGNLYDAHLVSEFVEAIGIFPPGSTVQLNNGQYGIVVRSNLAYEFRPAVLVLKDARQENITPYYVDLSDVTSKAATGRQIARMLRPEECGIDLRFLRDQEFLHAIAG